MSQVAQDVIDHASRMWNAFGFQYIAGTFMFVAGLGIMRATNGLNRDTVRMVLRVTGVLFTFFTVLSVTIDAADVAGGYALNPVATVLAYTVTVLAALALLFWPIPDRPVRYGYDWEEEEAAAAPPPERRWWHRIAPPGLPLSKQVIHVAVFLWAVAGILGTLIAVLLHTLS